MAEHNRPDLGLVEVNIPKKQSLFGWLRSRFFAGMVIALPVVVTFLLLQFLISKIDEVVVPLLPPALNPESYLSVAVPGFGLIVLILFLTALGAIATNLIGRSVIQASDRLLTRVPIVRSVYSAFKQLVDVFANNATGQFNEVVLVEYPRIGSWAVGFVSTDAKGEIASRLGDGHVGVFVPTTPNPTSGFLIYVKSEDLQYLDMSVEDGAKLIFSAGLVVPGDLPAKDTTQESGRVEDTTLT